MSEAPSNRAAVALVVHDFDPRFGQGRYAVELARRLKTSFDLHIYANRFGADPEPGLAYRRVPAWRRAALSTVFTFLLNSERLLRRRRYDLIHAQGLTCWNADLVTAHICNAARYRRSPATPGWKALFPLLVTPIERRFYARPRIKRLIAVSHRAAAEVAQEYGWSKPLDVIYHGVDCDTFRPPATPKERAQARTLFKLEPDGWTWLFAGEAAKGLAPVIDQLPRFPQARLLAVSHSDSGVFQARARQLGVERQIVFHGSATEMAPAYNAADVFVYPSDYDTFGMVAAEAMASGLPVIAGRNIGAAEWIVPEENGLLCDATPESLGAALDWLRANPARASALGQAARATALANSWDACAAQTARIYHATLAARNTP